MNVLNITNKKILFLVQSLYDLLSSGDKGGDARYKDDQGYSLELNTSHVISCGSESLSMNTIRAEMPLRYGTKGLDIRFSLESGETFTTLPVRSSASMILIHFCRYLFHGDMVPGVSYAFCIDSLIDKRITDNKQEPIPEEDIEEVAAILSFFLQRFAEVK